MEFRSQETVSRWITVFVLATAALSAQDQYEFQVRHRHWRKGGQGVLRIDPQGLSFEEARKKEHSWKWEWTDIQQLTLAPTKLSVLTYNDSKWRLGVDREYEFLLTSGNGFDRLYPFLRDRLDRRFVAVLPDDTVKPLWQMPVKLLGRLWGSQGAVIVGEDRIVYKTDQSGQFRAWRYSDIENISSSGPFQLTLTTFERAKSHYGSFKGFNFQLKEPIDENRYNELWRRLNQSKGLKFITASKQREKEQ